jgi:anti-sigma B factor antagonist
MSLEFTVQENADHLILYLNGKCDIYNAKSLKGILIDCESKTNHLFINLKSVDEIHTSAIQIFLTFKKKMQSNKKKLTLVEHSKPVLELFDLFGLVSKFADKIHLTKDLKTNLKFQYGIKKSYEPY